MGKNARRPLSPEHGMINEENARRPLLQEQVMGNVGNARRPLFITARYNK